MKAGKKLMESFKEHRSLNSYAFKNSKEKIKVCTGNVCFEGADKHSQSYPVKEFVLSMKQAVPTWKQYRKFLKFLITKSNYSDLYLTKRTCDAIRYGLYLDCDMPANQVWFAACLARSGWEYPKCVKAFFDMIKEGVSPNIALVLCWYCGEGKMNISSNLLLSGSTNHKVVPYNTKLFDLVHSVNKPLKKLAQPLSEEFTSCKNVQASFDVSPVGIDIPRNYINKIADMYGSTTYNITYKDLAALLKNKGYQ